MDYEIALAHAIAVLKEGHRYRVDVGEELQHGPVDDSDTAVVPTNVVFYARLLRPSASG